MPYAIHDKHGFLNKHFPDVKGRIALIDYHEINVHKKEIFATFIEDMENLRKSIAAGGELGGAFSQVCNSSYVNRDEYNDFCTCVLSGYKLADESSEYEFAVREHMWSLYKKVKDYKLAVLPKLRNLSSEEVANLREYAHSQILNATICMNVIEQLNTSNDIALTRYIENKFKADDFNEEFLLNIACERPVAKLLNYHSANISETMALAVYNSKNVINGFYNGSEPAKDFENSAVFLHEAMHALIMTRDVVLSPFEKVSNEMSADSFSCIASAVIFGKTKMWHDYYLSLANFRLFMSFHDDSLHCTYDSIISSINFVDAHDNISSLTLDVAFEQALKIGNSGNHIINLDGENVGCVSDEYKGRLSTEYDNAVASYVGHKVFYPKTTPLKTQKKLQAL